VTDTQPITRWADLIMDWEIPESDDERFELHQRYKRIQELEMQIYGLPYKPLPQPLWYWTPQ
jgi:hypothetical protein